MVFCFFFLMIRRPPRSTQSRSSAASDVYKRQKQYDKIVLATYNVSKGDYQTELFKYLDKEKTVVAVSYTHLRAHETVLDLVCRLLLEKKHNNNNDTQTPIYSHKVYRNI